MGLNIRTTLVLFSCSFRSIGGAYHHQGIISSVRRCSSSHSTKLLSSVSNDVVAVVNEVDIESGNISVVSKEIGQDPSKGFREGTHILLLENVVTPQECKQLVRSACDLAEKHNQKRRLKSQESQPMCRLPIIKTAKPPVNKIQTSSHVVDTEIDHLCQAILLRAAAIIDDLLPSLVWDLFRDTSILALMQADNLLYSSREPAINVYRAGGRFLAHQDGQKLTVLIPLSSSNKDFEGGGTAFWPPDSRGHRVEPPSTCLKPSQGAMMLFAGHVTHAGLELTAGTRVVLVASFSKKIPGTSV